MTRFLRFAHFIALLGKRDFLPKGPNLVVAFHLVIVVILTRYQIMQRKLLLKSLIHSNPCGFFRPYKNVWSKICLVKYASAWISFDTVEILPQSCSEYDWNTHRCEAVLRGPVHLFRKRVKFGWIRYFSWKIQNFDTVFFSFLFLRVEQFFL